MWILSLLVILLLLGLAGYRYDKRDWNNGVCNDSQLPWIQFDTNSQGERGYTDNDGHYIWISYPVDKK
jgi:hypothetical protein